jgi:hypothetical protein
MRSACCKDVLREHLRQWREKYMDPTIKTIPKPADYVCPLSAEACSALDQLIQMEQTQQYNIQQCGLCGLTLEQYQARSQQRLALAKLIQEHIVGAS